MPATSQESAARRYRIEKYLTEGGMGAIYIGKKLGPGGFAKEVVLKQLLPEYTSRPEFRDLFFREAKISATLDHANIVHTFDLVESDQSLFIVMEYVRGADLRTIIRRARHRRRELSPAAAIHVTLEILAGLGYAHTRRDATGKSLDIIHRDVSPSNIICSVQGAAKLSDFGIAKASTYSSVFYRVRGKVGYMSPEQARSQQIDHRCDLFSLSVCLYESLSGERLFVGDLNTPADEIYGVPILPVSHKRPGLPRALDEVLTRALAPSVDDRYQSAAELAEALRTVAHRGGLAFSAPELAAHLRDILGDDPERWLRDEPVAAIAEPLPVAVGGSELVGTEAASIGIVNDIAEDEPGQSVLSAKGVSGSKDFDLDSMLNDEATRPGTDEGSAKRAQDPPAKAAGNPTPTGDDDRIQAAGTPPPVWTRDSGPFGLATPRPAVAVSDTATTPHHVSVSHTSSPIGSPAAAGSSSRQPARLPGVRPAPAAAQPPGAAPAGRPLPRATIRSPAVPPPFQPGARAAVAPPPAPPFPRGGGESRAAAEIEEPTPPPPGESSSSSSRAAMQPTSFDIEDALTPPPPARPIIGGQGVGSRGSPPAAYPLPTFEAPQHLPESGPAPLILNQPQTMDFKDAVSALLPEKKGGPPVWLGAILLLGSLVGGAAGAHRLTRGEMANALDDSLAPAAARTGVTPRGDDEGRRDEDRPPAPAARSAKPRSSGALPVQVPPPASTDEAPAPVGPGALADPAASKPPEPAASATTPASASSHRAKPATKRRGGKLAAKRRAPRNKH